MIVQPYVQLPRDQYAHEGAPAEWWWHIGTLEANGRRFGFEICASGYLAQDQRPPFLLASIMLTDVETGRHYQSVNAFNYVSGWAQTDPTQPWTVVVGAPGAPPAITMQAVSGNPLAMLVQAELTDGEVSISFSLTLESQRNPLLVWGTGRSPEPVDPKGSSLLAKYNYYYSLTDLNASGTITIDGDVVEIFDVAGVTWMDHEYGAWPQHINWTLQAIRLDNGVCLSNFTGPNTVLKLGITARSQVTMLDTLGNSTFYSSTVTPIGETWPGPNGIVYFLSMLVKIPDLDAELIVTSLIPNQAFSNPDVPLLEVYEGVAQATGSFQGQRASGTAWNEQRLTPQDSR